MEYFLLSPELFCFIILIAVAVLIYQLSRIRQDISSLKQKIASMQQSLRHATATRSRKINAPKTAQHVEEIEPCVQDEPGPLSQPLPTLSDEKTPPIDDIEPVSPSAQPSQPYVTAPTPQAPQSFIWRYLQPKLKQAASFLWQHSKQWLTRGNVPVRVGMLVLFAGIAALLKQLNTQGWLYVPLYARLLGIACIATIGLAFGWQQRHKRHNFALTLQGGTIAILMFTLFAAYRLYALIPSSIALFGGTALMIGMTALAVFQRARILTQLALLGCFSAPILMTCGHGHANALFCYYALLDITIMGIAWIRPWRELNLLGFLFTYGIGITKGVLEYDASHLATTEFFLWLFFALYLTLPLLYAYRAPVRLRSSIDASLMFGTPLITLALQSSIMLSSDLTLAQHLIALSALLMSGIYAVLAVLCCKQWGWHLLSEIYTVLAASLLTIAVPLTFDLGMTSYIFAVEGIGLVWLGLRESRLLAQIAGLFLQLYPALYLAYCIAVNEDTISIVMYIHALILLVAAGICTWLYHRSGTFRMTSWLYGYTLMIWGITHLVTIISWQPPAAMGDAFVILFAVTACATAWVHRYMRLAPFQFVPHILLMLCGLLTLPDVFMVTTPLSWFADVVLLVAGATSLSLSKQNGVATLPGCSTYFWLLSAIRFSLSGFACTENISGMTLLIMMLPWLILGGVLLLHTSNRVPLKRYIAEVAETPALYVSVTTALIAISLTATLSSCTSALPWLPLLNPAEFGQLAALILLWRYNSSSAHASWSPWCLRIGAAWLVNESLLHTLHHWWGIEWQLSALLSSGMTQLSVTLLWSIIGVIGWLTASHQQHHTRWRIYAILMGIVLVKLVVIDRLYLGSLTGIMSFVAYGLLCVLLGFIAPIPPQRHASEKNASHS